MRNTFGNLFTLTTFGESHGIAVGGVIDGFPAGIEIDMDFIQSELNRRRPGQSHITTSVNEADKVEFLSGVFEGKSTGTPIGFEVRNTNQHSQDYENMRCLFRPSHADYTYHEKYGIRDHRGGGRSSARITIAGCVGGALAKLALRQLGISVTAYTSQVGNIALDRDYRKYDLTTIEDNIVRCPDQEKAKQMEDLIAKVKSGSVIPLEELLHVLSRVVLLDWVNRNSINCMRSWVQPCWVSMPSRDLSMEKDLEGVTTRGSEQNDVFIPAKEAYYSSGRYSYRRTGCYYDNQPQRRHPRWYQQWSGHLFPHSIQTRSYYLDRTAYSRSGKRNPTLLKARGRHDPCVLPRAVPVVEAMAAMVILDNYLLNKTVKL